MSYKFADDVWDEYSDLSHSDTDCSWRLESLSIMPRQKTTGKKARAPKAGARGHKLPDPLPPGEIFKDYCKKEWKLGKPIGAGGFGLIYLVDVNSPGTVSDNAKYVMKVEPHSNGPLFCELHFYQRVAKQDYIKEWMASKKLKHLALPQYIASGSHENKATKYRYMVMERCGTDLQKMFEGNSKCFPEKTVYLIGIQMLDALEYIHAKEYVHADIKASNILTGFGKGKSDEVYLVDYGLAFRYSADGRHKEYKEDPKRVHDGTIEFTSCDAHRGVAPSRRGDLEILAYCMLQWLCQKLPWEDNLDNKEYVRDSKIKYTKNVSGLLKRCLPTTKHDELCKFLQYSVDLKYEEQPDYAKCRQWFKQALKRLGGSESDKLVLNMKGAASPRKATPKIPRKRKSQDGDRLPMMVSSDSETEFQDDRPKSKVRKRTTPRAKPKTATPRSATPKRHTPSGVRKRVTENGEIIAKPAVPPPGLIQASRANITNGRSKSPTRRVVKKKAAQTSTATQTTPKRLKGLARSCTKEQS